MKVVSMVKRFAALAGTLTKVISPALHRGGPCPRGDRLLGHGDVLALGRADAEILRLLSRFFQGSNNAVALLAITATGVRSQ
jgi:hypothetical protein